ncbi:RCC1/BLIP-II [Violaceomyces palustris]|uniref:RCC1/BLIP-II n=1 Tax=Violaceomyces palustris TaxID=1673888 RepID=A0ACD0NR11_9BASI|nr:RCC1/BLIP-II [Violaceomyces palustris]
MAAAGTPTPASDDLPQWGRVLITGGTDWPILGRKPAKGQVQAVNEKAPDLPGPHILRALCNVKMRRVITSHSSCHAVFLAVNGDAYIVGRNEQGQCGFPVKPAPGQIGGLAIYEPLKLDRKTMFSPTLPQGDNGKIVAAATGRSHTLLVTKNGQIYSSGSNAFGQCGHERLGNFEMFTKIETAAYIKEKDPVIAVSCGLTFSLILTTSGKVYALGSSEKGQLGNGRTGEHFISGNKLAFNTFTEPLLIKGLADKKITQIACGQQHSIAMDEDGLVYAWGFGGYGRLGIGSQQDQLLPALVPQFAKENTLTRARKIFAGPTNSAVIDGQKMFWLAGKWKNSGEGSAGQGYMTFKYLPDLMGCRIRNVGLGGVTLFCTAEEDPSLRGSHDATMNVAWGQNAQNGELGLGPDKPKSATKPQRCETLDGISILEIAAGQNTTYYVARNLGEAYSELNRFPEHVDSSEMCVVCQAETKPSRANPGEEDALLECEKCENPYHLSCLTPPLEAVPDGEWHCPQCVAEAADGEEEEEQSTNAKSGSGKKAAGGRGKASGADGDINENGEEADEEESSATNGGKRGRAKPKANSAGASKRRKT